MDEFKVRAREKIDNIHEAAATVVGRGKTKVEDAYQHTTDLIDRGKELVHQAWHHEMIEEARQRVVEWFHHTVQRIKDGARPLSPVLLYNELVAILKDRVWRKGMIIFACGAACGCLVGVAAGLRAGSRPPPGPHCRALLANPHTAVMLVDDAVTPGAGYGEVLVRVQAFTASVEDRGVLRGRGSALRALLSRPQITVGRGFAGVILDAGPGVSELELGDEVWGCLSEWNCGAAAELLTVRSTRVSKRPNGIPADAAASLTWPGTTALSALRKIHYNADTCKGKRVAVTGASSAEGCILVQLLNNWGAHVTAHAPQHSKNKLMRFGAHDFIEARSEDGAKGTSWAEILEATARNSGPWDAVFVCNGAIGESGAVNALLKSTAPRNCIVDLRPKALLTDRLPTPFSVVFAVTFFSYRLLRWTVGYGTNTDWLEDESKLTSGLSELRELVDLGQLTPVLDKVYLPQDFETALAHACSEEATGTTVVRFP